MRFLLWCSVLLCSDLHPLSQPSTYPRCVTAAEPLSTTTAAAAPEIEGILSKRARTGLLKLWQERQFRIRDGKLEWGSKRLNFSKTVTVLSVSDSDDDDLEFKLLVLSSAREPEKVCETDSEELSELHLRATTKEQKQMWLQCLKRLPTMA